MELLDIKIEADLPPNKIKREPSVEYSVVLTAAIEDVPQATEDEPAIKEEDEPAIKEEEEEEEELINYEPKPPLVKYASSSDVFKRYLKDHKPIHDKSHHCEICQKKFATSRGLKQHQKQQHGIQASSPKENASEGTVDCDECDKWFASSKSLISHKRNVHEDKKVMCKLCNKYYKNQHSLLGHMRTHIKKECPICHKMFSKVARHMRKHKTEIFIKCDLCDYSSQTKYQLKAHIERMHLLRLLVNHSKSREEAGEDELLEKLQLKHGSSETTSSKKFKCDKCGKSFVTAHILTKHKKVVHPKQFFQCEICQILHKTKFNLNHHKVNVHGEKVACSICGKFLGQFYMRYHMKLHVPGQHYECDLCGFKAEHKIWLAGHMKKHRTGRSTAQHRTGRRPTQQRHRNGLTLHRAVSLSSSQNQHSHPTQRTIPQTLKIEREMKS